MLCGMNKKKSGYNSFLGEIETIDVRYIAPMDNIDAFILVRFWLNDQNMNISLTDAIFFPDANFINKQCNIMA